jgi:hypothetical protein
MNSSVAVCVSDEAIHTQNSEAVSMTEMNGKPSLEINLSCATLIADTEMDISVSVHSSKETTEHDTKDSLEIDMNVDIGDSSVSFVETTCSTTIMPLDTVILPDTSSSGDSRALVDTASEFRHGISRYAPYGTRFAARMKDGQFKTSHIAGDLANRARCKNGKGGRVDLILVTHEGEKHQLETALAFYESQMKKSPIKPGPSEVLNHLKDMNCDWDYRKGDGEKLLQRNASNFFKRMMEHARRIGHRLAQAPPPAPTKPSPAPSVVTIRKQKNYDMDVSEAAAILETMMNSRFDDEYDTDYSSDTDYANESIEMSEQESFESYESMVHSDVTYTSANAKISKRKIDWSLPKHHKGSFFYELCKFAAMTRKEQSEFYSKAAEVFDWNKIPQDLPELTAHDSENFETDDFIPVFQKPRKIAKAVKLPKPQVARPSPAPYSPPSPIQSCSVVVENPQPVIRKSKEGASGFLIKGLSRHSPYGTRFCAMMPNGEMRESFLAGDLADRAKGPDGKSQGELILVLHHGEIRQLEVAWEYVQTQEPNLIGAGAVLDYLRSLDLDHNHRKAGTRLLQKNAGNFFKRVQEYGRRKMIDPNYLSLN